MNNLPRQIGWRRQDGSVAVEAALIMLLVLVPLLFAVFLFGKYFWYYSVAHKAAHDASIYLASAPLADIRANAASALAARLINDEIGDIDDDTAATLGVTTECLFRIPANSNNIMSFACSTNNLTPALVRASVSMTVKDPFLSAIAGPVVGGDGLNVMAGVTMRYVGR